MTPLWYAMGHIQVVLVVRTPFFRLLNCSYLAILQLHSSMSIESAIFGHHSKVQYLLCQEFLMSVSSVQYVSVIPLNRVVMLQGMFSNGRLLQLPSTAGIFVPFDSGLQSLDSFAVYACPHEQASRYTTMDCFTSDSGFFALVSSEQMVLAVLKSTLMSKPLRILLISSLTPAT